MIQLHAVYRKHTLFVSLKDTNRLKLKGWKKIYQQPQESWSNYINNI